MGHAVNAEWEYRLLRRRMDHSPTCVPETPEILRILEILFTPEEARFARQLPTRPASLSSLSRRLAIPEKELEERMTGLAQRGLIVDALVNGEPHYVLVPVLGGIFEFIFMRVREELPLAELAKLFDEYMNRDGTFARLSYDGETQFARTFVREEAIPEGDHTEILDWERVTKIIETASLLSIALCPCRHKMEHLGKACNAPQRTCISLNGGAEVMIRGSISQRIDAREAIKIVEECKEQGLAQTGDNVRDSVTFLCNCCGCCCTLMQAVRALDSHSAVVTSNWVRDTAGETCTGCGQCVNVCPVRAIEIKERRAVTDQEVCLGCGVCYTACKTGATRMKPRPQRVYVPETGFEKTIRMAIERGKLAELVFDNPERLSHRALGRILNVLEKSPPGKALMAVQPLRSVFLNAMLRRR